MSVSLPEVPTRVVLLDALVVVLPVVESLSGKVSDPNGVDKVEIKDGSVSLGFATVANDGTWSFTPTTALADGTHNLAAVATQQSDGSWAVTTTDVSHLAVVTPPDYTGAEVLNITASCTNADGSTGLAYISDNVEAYAPGTPIFAWSGDDTLTGSAAADEFVFSQPIGNDVVHSFDASCDKIDLIGYSGVSSFADVQAHLTEDSAGNAVIALADGQSITLEGVTASSLTAADFEFNAVPVVTNAGMTTIDDGAMLPLSGTINNSGTIILGGDSATTVLELIQNGITLQGAGHLVLSDSAMNEIVGSLQTVGRSTRTARTRS